MCLDAGFNVFHIGLLTTCARGTMDRRFAAEEWEALTTADRTRRCNVMAQEAIKLANNAPPHLAEGYLLLAEQWLRLGMEIGREAQS
jgi:hypothetical protein